MDYLHYRLRVESLAALARWAEDICCSESHAFGAALQRQQ